jgi:hypothetical protein
MPIERGDSWFSPKCIEVQRRRMGVAGRATGWPRGLTRLPKSTKLRMVTQSKAAVRRPGISLVVERETAQTLC